MSASTESLAYDIQSQIDRQFHQNTVAAFFLGGSEMVYTSVMEPDALKAKLRETLRGVGDYTMGAHGYIFGESVHVGWSYGWQFRPFTTVFHGRIEAAPAGSQLRGRISARRFVQLYMAVWFGGVAFFSLVFVWTLFIPAAGFALIWLGCLFIGDNEAEKEITSYLTSICLESVEQIPDSLRGKNDVSVQHDELMPGRTDA